MNQADYSLVGQLIQEKKNPQPQTDGYSQTDSGEIGAVDIRNAIYPGTVRHSIDLSEVGHCRLGTCDWDLSS